MTRQPKTNKRKRILVDASFQLRVALWGGMLAVLEIALAAVAMAAVVLTSVWIPAGFHVAMFYKLVWVISGAVVVFTLVNVVLGILLSQRIAGPAYRLKQSMQRIAEGDVSFLISLRESDELQDLKDTFNDMVSALRDRLLTLRPQPNPRQRKKPAPVFPFKLD